MFQKSPFCLSSAAFGPRVSTCADYYAKLAEVEENLRKARESREMQVLAILKFPLTVVHLARADQSEDSKCHAERAFACVVLVDLTCEHFYRRDAYKRNRRALLGHRLGSQVWRRTSCLPYQLLLLVVLLQLERKQTTLGGHQRRQLLLHRRQLVGPCLRPRQLLPLPSAPRSWHRLPRLSRRER
jgi:hypothetical protein